MCSRVGFFPLVSSASSSGSSTWFALANQDRACAHAAHLPSTHGMQRLPRVGGSGQQSLHRCPSFSTVLTRSPTLHTVLDFILPFCSKITLLLARRKRKSVKTTTRSTDRSREQYFPQRRGKALVYICKTTFKLSSGHPPRHLQQQCPLQSIVTRANHRPSTFFQLEVCPARALTFMTTLGLLTSRDVSGSLFHLTCTSHTTLPSYRRTGD
jgi:hypothetical protein